MEWHTSLTFTGLTQLVVRNLHFTALPAALRAELFDTEAEKGKECGETGCRSDSIQQL